MPNKPADRCPKRKAGILDPLQPKTPGFERDQQFRFVEKLFGTRFADGNVPGFSLEFRDEIIADRRLLPFEASQKSW